MIHRINVFLLSLFLVFSQTFIISTANAGIWNIMKGTATAGGVAVTGSASVGGALRTAAANIPWGALKNGLGKTLKIGGGVASIAVGLALNATDYVMDPANNEIRYKPTQVDNGTAAAYKYAYYIADTYLSSQVGSYFSTLSNACTVLIGHTLWKGSKVITSVKSEGKPNSSGNCLFYNNGSLFGSVSISYVLNPNYSPDAVDQDKEKTISLPDLIQRLIDQMGNNDAAIKNVLDQILETMIHEGVSNPEADKDIKAAVNTIQKALDGAAEYEGSGTATGTEIKSPTIPDAKDLSLEFPTFCGWAGIVCEGAQAAINFPDKVQEYVEGVKDWVKPETADDTDTKVDIDEQKQDTQPSQTYFTWSAYCPFRAETTQITIGDQTSQLDSDLSSWCDSASQLRPFVITAGAIISLMIVSGVYTRNDE
ncbi:hypothetical protein [Acinetobacter sp. MD2(2019)]|uniref:hypothetical protein n=1 Tax=Acinetobacter sp. MD2(2019) TaxID=2605273 RepID=UPI002D1EB7C5|nr:hypothetical protein [Acinetobacter sp. MD2(2019)]MEB3755190.1 hypothetical protein [Acinetobacter sp. MD2(2019)]